MTRTLSNTRVERKQVVYDIIQYYHLNITPQSCSYNTLHDPFKQQKIGTRTLILPVNVYQLSPVSTDSTLPLIFNNNDTTKKLYPIPEFKHVPNYISREKIIQNSSRCLFRIHFRTIQYLSLLTERVNKVKGLRIKRYTLYYIILCIETK